LGAITSCPKQQIPINPRVGNKLRLLDCLFTKDFLAAVAEVLPEFSTPDQKDARKFNLMRLELLFIGCSVLRWQVMQFFP